MTFQYEKLLQLSDKNTDYEKISEDGISLSEFEGKEILKVEDSALEFLAHRAMEEVSFKLRSRHLEMVAGILDDPEASDNDRFVARTLLENAEVAARGELPSCQDTGTAIVLGKKGQQVFTTGDDAEPLSHGIYNAYTTRNLRYSQMAPLDMFQEKNTGCNLPAQVDILSEPGSEYHFLFMAKGGGSANKTYLYQETKSLLNEKRLAEFLDEKIRSLGTAACPPYHLALVIGGSSAEINLKLVKLASAGYLDGLPTSGSEQGRVFRDLEWEKRVAEIARNTGIGAQFGGKYFVHDVRVIRMFRHAASCPVGIGVSCSADRNILAKITREGIFLEKLEDSPARFLESRSTELTPPVSIDLDRSMPEILAELSKHPVKTRLSLSGTMIVARDIAHARIAEMLDRGEEMPAYFREHPVYYAGPAKTPEGMPTGSFGPTTAGRMDIYVKRFQEVGASLIMVAKGNRDPMVTAACKNSGGFYLGSIGGPAAILAQDNIREVEVIDFAELGMEAVRKIRVENFPAFIIVDGKGNDFFDAFR